MTPETLETDVLVIGSGIAGLTFALKVAGRARVLLVTKKERAASNTNYARGGIAAVLSEDDDPSLHVRDTLVAGAGLCHADRVRIMVREGPTRVRELIDWGTRFHMEDGRLSLGREGGHSRRRIAHVGDRTGQEIERSLLAAVEASGSITVREDYLAVDLLAGRDRTSGERRCGGALVLDHARNRFVEIRARATMLATGGFGQVYRHTTNPAIATGDGVAMAFRAGAAVANLEFVQFHPTALFPTEDPAFLISEALRGEGAVLRRLDGTPFMERWHPLGSLAPRDIVARAVDAELKATGETHVVLDVTPIGADAFAARFPGALEGCLARGIDPFDGGIPVVPAAHYACGGVLTGMEAESTLGSLFVSGEAACTGVHGANRLASNSLLEALVLSHRAADAVLGALNREPPSDLEGPELLPALATGDYARQRDAAEGPGSDSTVRDARRTGIRKELRDLMWERVGIVRSDAWLDEAVARLADLGDREAALRGSGPLDDRSIELRNLVILAGLITRSARARQESRGLHYNADHPFRNNERLLRDTVLVGQEGPGT